jgi:hypothetical protein
MHTVFCLLYVMVPSPVATDFNMTREYLTDEDLRIVNAKIHTLLSLILNLQIRDSNFSPMISYPKVLYYFHFLYFFCNSRID